MSRNRRANTAAAKRSESATATLEVTGSASAAIVPRTAITSRPSCRDVTILVSEPGGPCRTSTSGAGPTSGSNVTDGSRSGATRTETTFPAMHSPPNGAA
jgi:hypothetical protein